MKTICISNIKGGCGKTTTATCLAALLAREYKVLFIDIDDQMNGTYTFGGKSDGVPTVYDLIVGTEDISVDDTIQDTEIDNLKLIASDELLKEVVFKMQSDADSQYAIKDIVTQVEDKFDYIIIDTKPNANILLRAGLIASDEVIIPVLADGYSAQGMAAMSKELNAIKKRINPNLHIAGVLFCNYEKNTITSAIMTDGFKQISEVSGIPCFDTTIPKSIKVTEAVSIYRKSIVQWKPSHPVSMSYERFMEELFEKGVL